MKKIGTIFVGLMLLLTMMMVFTPSVSADANYTELELIPNTMSVKNGTQITIGLYVTPQTGTWIDTVATDEVTFSSDKLQFVGDGVSWGNLFQQTTFQIDGTPDNTNGVITDIVWGAENTSTPGWMYNMTFNTIHTGYAYINLTWSEIGVALDGNDMPKTVNSNCTIYIHEYIPSEPTDFIATAVGNTQIDLSWTKGTDADKTYIEWNSVPTWNMGEGTLLYNGTGTSTNHTGLNPHATYYYQAWSWNNTDSFFSTTYASANNNTLNTQPNQPTNEIPTNNSDYVSVYDNYLNVTVSDDDGDSLNVSFYWGNSTLIHTVTNIASGNVASIFLPNYTNPDFLLHDTDYTWYVTINDTRSEIQSPTYTFHTSKAPDINEDRTVNYLDVSLLVSHYGESVSPPGSKGWDINSDGDTNYLDVSALVTAYGDNY